MKIKNNKLMAQIVLSTLIILILGIFNQCGMPLNSEQKSKLLSSNVTSTTISKNSVEAFSQTVYQITSNRCVACHKTQQPVHASPNVQEAHDAVINQYKVNFTNIPQSRLVQKIKTESHGCWGNCQSNADEMQTAIQHWYDLISAASTSSTATGATTSVSKNYHSAYMSYPSPLLKDVFATLANSTAVVDFTKGTIKAPFQITGNPSYLEIPAGAGDLTGGTEANAGTATIPFTVKNAGIYQLYGVVTGPDTSSDSVFITVDNGTQFSWTFSQNTTVFAPLLVTNGNNKANISFNLTAGNHTLRLRQREDNVKIKSLSFALTPSSSIASSSNAALLQFDVGGLLKDPKPVYFQVYLEEFDDYSYKVSLPHFANHTRSIHVKNIKLFINDFYNPQHSAYTLVDKVITPTSPLVADNAMIVLKDKGTSQDVISFGFDVIEYTTATSAATATVASNFNPAVLVNSATSITAFQGSVYPLARSYCISCHQNTAPRSANANVTTAHNDLIQQSKIDFITPVNSRMVQRLQVDQHHCWTNNCINDGETMKNAIIQWYNQVKNIR